MSIEYPQAGELEERLKELAIQTGDPTLKPFRVDLVKVHGGKPPIYSVVILSYAKAPLRQTLEKVLNRSLTCGVSSFLLKAEEAVEIVKGVSN